MGGEEGGRERGHVASQGKRTQWRIAGKEGEKVRNVEKGRKESRARGRKHGSEAEREEKRVREGNRKKENEGEK